MHPGYHRPMPRSIPVVALALVAACASTPTTTPPPPPTTTTSTTAPTTTTVPTVESPVTGLPVDPDAADRRAVVVKIDNHPAARPQSGLDAADAVIELPVEGITRLAAVFHSGDAAAVGPVRSVRPSDWQLAALFDAPLVVSGGQGWVVARNRENGAYIIEEIGPPYTFRSSDRPRPHNLYADTAAVRELADERGLVDDPPAPLWAFGPLPAGSEPAPAVTAVFESAFRVTWTWTGTAWERSVGGTPQSWITADGSAEPVAVDTLVFLFTDTASVRGPSGGPAKAVESIGEGDAAVLSGGVAVRGHWSRPTPADAYTLTTVDGAPLPVPPGKPWISFLPRRGSLSW